MEREGQKTIAKIATRNNFIKEYLEKNDEGLRGHYVII